MRNIITDIQNIKLLDISTFDKIFLVGYGENELEELLTFNAYDNIEVLLPTSNFDKAYMEINKYISDFIQGDLELLALFKLCKSDLFNLGMILLALKKIDLDFEVSTKYNDYLIELEIVEENKLLNQRKNRYFKIFLKQLILLFAVNMKVFGMFIKSFFLKSKNITTLLMDYSAKKIVGELDASLENSQLIELESYGSLISFDGLKIFWKQQKRFLYLGLKYKILYQTLAKQAFYSMKIISLVNYYNPKLVLGVFDASPIADIYAIILKQYKVKFGCYSHGYNYDFRTEYIYIPFDFYFLWADIHLKQVETHNYIKSNCKFFITGSPYYSNTNFEYLRSIEREEEQYDMLVIGEYYYSNYSIQPFNSDATKQLARVLLQYVDKYKICIRPRSKDEYYDDIYSILGERVTYSFPENEATATTTILEDIMLSKLVLSTFSGGIHDALLLHKPVIQTNFIGIKEPKGFASNNVVYYADSNKKLKNLIESFFKNNLVALDFDKNNEYYFYNGKFDNDDVKKIVDEYI